MTRVVVSGARPHERRRMDEGSQPGGLRREVADMARSLGFDQETAGRAALVATELGGNLVKHARQGGDMLFRPLTLGDRAGIELLSLDRGPGMSHPGRMLHDGVSTAGSLGVGLGGARRLSDEFDLYSRLGSGTVILARIWDRPVGEDPGWPGRAWGSVILAKPGEDVCGDGWTVEFDRGRTRVLVADGLGHGPGAALAVREAMRAFVENGPRRPPAETLRFLHERLQGARGAAAIVAEIDAVKGELVHAGAGNVCGRILRAGEETRRLVSMNGSLGCELGRVQPFASAWGPGSLLVMHTDGVSSSWDLAAYPGLIDRHPALTAAVICRDFGRGAGRATDDLAVLAIRSIGPAGRA